MTLGNSLKKEGRTNDDKKINVQGSGEILVKTKNDEK